MLIPAGTLVEIGLVVLEKKFFFFNWRSPLSCLCKLKSTCDPLPVVPYKKIWSIIILYRKFLGWIIYSSVAFEDEAKFSASVFVQNQLFNLNYSKQLFIIWYDSCKPSCDLQGCKGLLSTYNYVLVCFWPYLTEIGPNKGNFHNFATITPCIDGWLFLPTNLNHLT